LSGIVLYEFSGISDKLQNYGRFQQTAGEYTIKKSEKIPGRTGHGGKYLGEPVKQQGFRPGVDGFFQGAPTMAGRSPRGEETLRA